MTARRAAFAVVRHGLAGVKPSTRRVTRAAPSLEPAISSISIRKVSECFSGGGASIASRAVRIPSARSPALTSTTNAITASPVAQPSKQAAEVSCAPTAMMPSRRLCSADRTI
ncbi:hypothetical protein [Nocardia gipuzkoensis]